jgi:SAM-dependent methyltransferase
MATQTLPVFDTREQCDCVDCGAPLLQAGACSRCEHAHCFVVGALRAYSPDHGVVATLGARTGGSVAVSAQHFQLAYEVDLSSASVVRSLDQREIRLTVADFKQLPFTDESLSAVVSQYLLHRLPDPVGVAMEIRRVLKGGGIWVNLSRRLVPVTGLGMLAGLGLEVVRCEALQFPFVDCRKMDAEGRRMQEVQFFVARRVPGQKAIRVAGWPASDARWQRIARSVRAVG